MLIDFGYTPEAMVNNANLLGVNPANLDAMVLSHGHYDHFGGAGEPFYDIARSEMPGKGAALSDRHAVHLLGVAAQLVR